MLRGAPLRGASQSASIFWRAYRLRHLPTVGKETLSRPAISVLLNPCEAPEMILARNASRWLDLGRFAIKVSFSFCAGLRTIAATGLRMLVVTDESGRLYHFPFPGIAHISEAKAA